MIRPEPPPDHALHAKYAVPGGYVDCFVTQIARTVTHAEFVAAFYTTWLFKLERLFLTWTVDKDSTDLQARELARGELTSFAAWTVEARAENQLLMCDFLGKTRSWFMVAPVSGDASATRLLFGTAIVPIKDRETGERRLSAGFRGLLGFHKVYSRALLSAARSRLERTR